VSEAESVSAVAAEVHRSTAQGDDARISGVGSHRQILFRLLCPPWLLVVSVLLSFLAWIIPWSSHIHTGYVERQTLTATSLLFLVAWYGWAIVVGVFGFRVGRHFAALRTLNAFPSQLYYRYFTIIGAIGVLYTYGHIVLFHPSLVVSAVVHQTFNDVRNAITYGAGIQTLRYAAILGGGVALYNILFRSKCTKQDALNLVLLVLASAAASRLSLVMATLVAVGLAATQPGRSSAQIVRVAVLAVIAFGGLTAFNYLRNANYYKANYATSNPLLMNLDESVAYLGAPFQASVVAAKLALHDRLKVDRRNLALNPGAGGTTEGWTPYDGGRSPTPVLTRAEGTPHVASGSLALQVDMANPSAEPMVKYVWLSDQNATAVSPGDRLFLRAIVSGPASAVYPIRLGVRLDDGSVTQAGLQSQSSSLTLRHTSVGSVLEGGYIAPRDTATIQLAIWKELAPHSHARVVLEGAVVKRRSVAPLRRPPLFHSLVSYVVPTYAAPTFTDVARAENAYRKYTSIEAILTTNSALAAMYGALGTFGAFAVLGAMCFLAAALAGHASRYESLFVVVAFIASYVFAELWRVYLFNYGIIQFLLILMVVPPFVHRPAAALFRRSISAVRRAR